jgi:hypothetical protein
LQVLQIPQTRLGKISPALFLVAGAIWLVVTVAGGDLVLIWPGLASILSGISLLLVSGKPLRRPLGVASSIFGLAIAIYQTALSATLLGTTLGLLAIPSFLIFLLLSVLELVLFYLAAKNY